MTIVKQPSFWIVLVSVPLMMATIVLISYFTNVSSNKDVDPNKNDLRIAMIDESGLISREMASAYKLDVKSGAALEKMTQDVKSGQLDGLIVYPDDLSKSGKYQVVADNTEDDNARIVTALAKILLQQSLLEPLKSQELATLALSGGESQVSSYKKGELTQGFASYIVPGSFLVIFYLVLVFAVGYALSSVSDEKENRSIEMVLSYVKPQTLILGKLVGVILVTLTQIAFFTVVGVIGYFIARALGNELSLPFSLSDVVFEPTAILFGLAFLVVGFIFYVSVMATIGAIFPSAKEASGFSTVFFILPAVPFWGSKALTSDPSSTFTQIVTYFPFSAPTASLLRNAAGNLTVTEGLISLVILILAAIGTILLAGKAFRLGTLEYNSRIKFADLFRR
jgi:ABC-2 type transport system permease protein